KNTIALQIFRWTDGSYLECQDFWRISGIERSVYLYAQPNIRIRDIDVVSLLDDTYKTGDFNLSVKLQNHTFKGNPLVVDYKLTDPENNQVSAVSKSTTMEKGGKASVDFSARIPSVKRWTAEHPNLYTLLITTKDKKGNVLEVVSNRIGFRSVEIKQGLLLVNGQRITLKGVNTQETDPDTGHVMDEAMMMKDISMWKENNINAVRLSHYPRADKFYELCDKYGIYVVDEA